MNTKDLTLLAASLAGVLTLVALAALAPIYRMPTGTYERRWVWDAPTMPVGHGYNALSPEDIARLSEDPGQRRILEDMKAIPRSIPISPTYLGSRRGPDRNPLGYAAMFSVVVWLMFAMHKWNRR